MTSLVERKCDWCGNKIYVSLDSFAEFGWEAFENHLEKPSRIVVGCPKHLNELREAMKLSLLKTSNKKVK
jgi:hypothetical protein